MTTSDPEVLLVEDNTSDAELILLSMGEWATRTLHLHDGEEALAYLLPRGEHPAAPVPRALRLILLDIKLPKVDGLEVLQQVKAATALHQVPVVLLSSSKIERDVAEGYRSGANSYVQKPVEFDRFRETMRRLTEYWLLVNEPPQGSR